MEKLPDDLKNDFLNKDVPSHTPPLSKSPLYKEAELLRRKENELHAEIKRKVEEYAKSLYAENHDNIENIEIQQRKTKTLAEQETKKNLRQFIKEAYEGKYGKGSLVFYSDNIKHVNRLLRVIEITQQDNESMQYLNQEQNRIKEQMGIPGEVLLQEDSIDTKDINTSLRCLFAEVSLEGTTNEEYNQLFRSLTSMPTSDNPSKRVHDLFFAMDLFPTSFKPDVASGEMFKFGSSGHHSGEIEGFALILPTGRIAIISRYGGEKGYMNEIITNFTGESSGDYKEQHLWGATDNPRWKPDFSARSGTLINASDLTPLTEEEIAFLRGNLETKKKTGAIDESPIKKELNP